MTNPVETIEDDCALQPEQTLVSVVEGEASRQNADVEFLDEEWSREFDRRLAAWEAESPSPVPATAPLSRK